MPCFLAPNHIHLASMLIWISNILTRNIWLHSFKPPCSSSHKGHLDQLVAIQPSCSLSKWLIQATHNWDPIGTYDSILGWFIIVFFILYKTSNAWRTYQPLYVEAWLFWEAYKGWWMIVGVGFFFIFSVTGITKNDALQSGCNQKLPNYSYIILL